MDEKWLINNAWRALPHTMATHLTTRYPLPNGVWLPYEWLVWLSAKLAAGIAEGGKRYLISAPVRHGKSELVSVWLPTWCLEMWPQMRVILSSYEATFASSWGRRVRNNFELCQPDLWTRLSNDSKAIDNWHTSAGGGLFTAGVGGALTGRGGNVIILDDPIKNSEEADSEIMRAKIKDWFFSTLYTRAEPGSTVIVMMARWHEDDLYAHLKGNLAGGWEEICLPALAGPGDILGRAPGDALCPERFDGRALRQILKEQQEHGTERWWQALYQQNPTSAEGNELKRIWWRRYEKLPDRFDFVCASWDCSFKDSDGSDYVVGQVWGVQGSNRYLLDQCRGKFDFPTTLGHVIRLGQQWKPSATLVEDKANGSAIVSCLKQMGQVGVVAVDPEGGKQSRARAIAPQLQAGNVYVPETTWANELIDESAAFPRGKHDDQVDAMSQALIYLSSWHDQPEAKRNAPRKLAQETYQAPNQGPPSQWETMLPSIARQIRRNGSG